MSLPEVVSQDTNSPPCPSTLVICMFVFFVVEAVVLGFFDVDVDVDVDVEAAVERLVTRRIGLSIREGDSGRSTGVSKR